MKEPLPASQADSILKVQEQLLGHRRLAARPRFERGPPGSGPGVVPVPPPRIGLDGEIRTPSPRLPTPVRSRCATSRRVLTAGVEPALARLSTLCLCRLGYVSIGTDGRI